MHVCCRRDCMGRYAYGLSCIRRWQALKRAQRRWACAGKWWRPLGRATSTQHTRGMQPLSYKVRVEDNDRVVVHGFAAVSSLVCMRSKPAVEVAD